MRAFVNATDCRLVVTQPDRPAGRGQRLEPSPIKRVAQGLGIATLEPLRLRDALEPLRAAGAELFAVASYGKIVPQSVLDLPRLGALNVHPSLLPLYRGATPIQSQIRDGVREGGVSIILMDAGMDTGDIVLRDRTTVGPCETYGELHDRLAEMGAHMLAKACVLAADGKLPRIPQRGLASDAQIEDTLTRPLTKDDLRVDWGASAERIANSVRSLSPQPGARAALGGEVVKVICAVPQGDRGTLDATSPGTVLGTDGDALLVAAGSGIVAIERLVPPNRKAMSGREYFAGLRGS